MPATYYNVTLLTAFGGSAGTSGNPVVSGGLEVFAPFVGTTAGTAVVSGSSASDAIKSAVVGGISYDIYNDIDFSFNDDTVGLATTDHKPFLLEPVSGNTWRIRVESSADSTTPSWDYDDGYWDVSASIDTTIPANTAPTTAADRFVTGFNTPARLTPLDNDTDDDWDYLTLTAAMATNGTVSVAADGRSPVFTPATGYAGTATVTYTASDGNGGTATGTADVVVYDKPVATVSVPDDDITPDTDDTSPTAAYTLSLSGQTTQPTTVTYRITVLDGTGFTNAASQQTLTTTFSVGQTSQDKTYSLAGITTEVRIKIEVLAPTPPTPTPGGENPTPGAGTEGGTVTETGPGGPGGAGGGQQFVAAYAVDAVQSVRQLAVRQHVKLTIEYNEATEKNLFSDHVVKLKIDGYTGVQVTYKTMEKISMTDGTNTRSVDIATGVEFKLTRFTEKLGQRFGQDLSSPPPSNPAGLIPYDTDNPKAKHDNRSHLHAKRFGGQKDLRNNIPLDSTVNQKMRLIEEDIFDKATNLGTDASITIYVTPFYNKSKIRAELLAAAKENRTPDYKVARPTAVQISSVSNFLSEADPVSGTKKKITLYNK